MIRAAWIILTVLVLSGCGKASNMVPNVAVNLSLPLSDPRLISLTNSGRPVLIDGYGVAGLVLYRTALSGYVAYDRCSSYEPKNRCAIVPDNPSLTATDPCSGSKFSLTDGTPVKAPATRSLKQYSVTATQFELYVSN